MSNPINGIADTGGVVFIGTADFRTVRTKCASSFSAIRYNPAAELTL